MQRCGVFVRRGIVATTAAAAACAAPAQTGTNGLLSDAAQRQAVAGRARPDSDPVGIAAGAFRIYPSGSLQFGYDDNVFNSDVIEAGDASARVAPRILVQSQWRRHTLALVAGGQVERFAERKSENSEQFDVGAQGVLDLGRGMIGLGASYARRIEARGTLGDIFIAGDRIRYNLAAANGSLAVELAGLQLTATGSLSDFDYLPVRSAGGRILQDYRDHRETTGSLRADYRTGPGLRLFVSGTYNDQHYGGRLAGIDQGSHGRAVLAGASFGLTELISGEIGVGYLRQSYDEPTFGHIAGFTYNGRLVWNPTPLVTLNLRAARTTQPSPFVDQVGILQDSGELTADYEVLRNLIVSAAGSVVRNRYRSSDRADRLKVAELRVRYLVSRSCEAGLVLNHRRQSTSGAFGRRYAGSGASLNLTFKR